MMKRAARLGPGRNEIRRLLTVLLALLVALRPATSGAELPEPSTGNSEDARLIGHDGAIALTGATLIAARVRFPALRP